MINLFITGSKPTVQRVTRPDLVEFIVVDLFCGAGGTTTGFDRAKVDGHPVALVIACVNHDPKALESHWQNHPDVVHFEEDIRTLNLQPLVDLVNEYRKVYPKAKVILWASLECTNYSKAKGGQPRDADSRTLPESLINVYDPQTKKYHKGDSYVQMIKPDYIQIENVVEFMSWGPMRIVAKKKHKENLAKGIYANTELKFIFNKKTQQEEYAWTPISKKNGIDFRRWESKIQALGYRSEWRQLNAADFAAYTSRNRLFGCFAKDDLPISWPTPTHAKEPTPGDLFGGGLKKWKAVKEVLDFEDEGHSIFRFNSHRKKPHSPNTHERVYAGLIKFVAGGKDAFMLKWNSVSKGGDYQHTAGSIDEPCATIPCQNRIGAAFICKHFSGRPEGKVVPVSGPAGTATTSCNQSLVQPIFMINYNRSSKCNSINDACPTLLCREKLGPVNVSFIQKYYGHGDNIQSVDDPAPTVPCADVLTKVQTNWIDRNFTGGGQMSSILSPVGSMPTVPKLNKVQADSFILKTSYGNIGNSINGPAPTLLASRRHHYIVNPSHGGHSMSVDRPCPVIIARQDKSPLYLLQADEGYMPVFDGSQFFLPEDWHYIETGEGEKSIRIKIVEFCFLYGISDVKMRMLKVSELLPIQGFAQDYVLIGNQSDQKKFIGNSVHPDVVVSWTLAMRGGLKTWRDAA